MAQANFNVVLGCTLANPSHIDYQEGIFGVLEEGKKPHLERHAPIPSRNNTACPSRKSARCSIECRFSKYGIQVGYKIHYHTQKRM